MLHARAHLARKVFLPLMMQADFSGKNLHVFRIHEFRRYRNIVQVEREKERSCDIRFYIAGRTYIYDSSLRSLIRTIRDRKHRSPLCNCNRCFASLVLSRLIKVKGEIRAILTVSVRKTR